MDRFEDILDQCLEAVLRGGEDVDAALSRFPDHEARLRPLVNLALAGREALRVEVPREAYGESKVRVMEGVKKAAARQKLERDAVSFSPRRWRLGLRSLAWITAVFVLLMSGTALAASAAGPDSLLYPLKQRMEEARTTLAWDSLDRANTEARHAQERLDEIAAMVNEGKPELVPDLVYRYELHLDKAIGYANDAAVGGEDTDEIYATIDGLKDRFDKLMNQIYDDLPDNIRGELFGGASGGVGTGRAGGGMVNPAGPTPTPGHPGGESDDEGAGGYDDDAYENGGRDSDHYETESDHSSGTASGYNGTPDHAEEPSGGYDHAESDGHEAAPSGEAEHE